MPSSTIPVPEAKPVANDKMGTRMEGGQLLYIAGQVAAGGDLKDIFPPWRRHAARCFEGVAAV